MKKVIRNCLYFILFLSVSAIALAGGAYWSLFHHPEYWGSQDLGDGFFLLELDHKKSIVYGSVIYGKTCFGGLSVVPYNKKSQISFSHVTSSPEPNVTVLEVMYDKEWITAKIYYKESDTIGYCIVPKSVSQYIDKLENHYYEYLIYFKDERSFIQYCHNNSIDLLF